MKSCSDFIKVRKKLLECQKKKLFLDWRRRNDRAHLGLQAKIIEIDIGGAITKGMQPYFRLPEISPEAVVVMASVRMMAFSRNPVPSRSTEVSMSASHCTRVK